MIKLTGLVMVALGFSALNDWAWEMIEQSRGQDSAGKRFQWSVSSEDLQKQPSWDPATQEIPLSPHAAAVSAKAWLETQGQTNPVVTRIYLNGFGGPEHDKWQYHIQFVPAVEAQQARPRPSFAIVLLDGSIVEPRLVESNALTSATSNALPRTPFARAAPATNSEAFKMPAGLKASYETVEAKVLKVFAAEDNGAKFHAYLVKWKDREVIVSDPLSRTDKKEGDSITFMASSSELPHGDEKIRVLNFMLLDYDRRAKPRESTSPTSSGDATNLPGQERRENIAP